MLAGHGGNIYETARRLGCSPDKIIDMSSNINPLGPPPGLLDYLTDNISAASRLPEVDSRETVMRFAEYLDIADERLLAGNGTTQFIYSIPQVLGSRKALIAGPTYSDYADACSRHRVSSSLIIAGESTDFRLDTERLGKSLAGIDTVFLCNPNNPTGSLIPKGVLVELCRSHPQTNFVVDESYLPFVSGGDKESMVTPALANVIVLASISKIFAIPGLRIGFVAAAAATIEKIRQLLLPWSVNGFAQAAVQYLTAHRSLIHTFIEDTRRFIREQREEFDEHFRHVSAIKLYPSAAPFFLARLPDVVSAESAWSALANEKILIRNCSNFAGLSNRFIRISLKARESNHMLAERLAALVTFTDGSNRSFPKKQCTGV